MATAPEPPITIQELVELQQLELAARGETQDDAAHSLRARLVALRSGEAYYSSPLPRPAGSSLEVRLPALEGEVERLRELIEDGRNNG